LHYPAPVNIFAGTG